MGVEGEVLKKNAGLEESWFRSSDIVEFYHPGAQGNRNVHDNSFNKPQIRRRYLPVAAAIKYDPNGDHYRSRQNHYSETV